jgi:hypothetical protein
MANGLSKEQLEDLCSKLGKEEFEASASVLVQILNHKYGGKNNGKQFVFGDIQQYYLRKKLPDDYSGVNIEMKKGATGKYLLIHKDFKEDRYEQNRA